VTDEFALRRDTEKAVRAQALMDDETLKDAFARLESAYIEEWRTTGARDNDARERLWIAINVVGKVREHLGRLVAGGKVAQKQLDELENRSKLEQIRRSLRVV